jgi:hypothetical protein
MLTVEEETQLQYDSFKPRWEPMVALSAQIPKRLSNELDECVYLYRKKGLKVTKQAIVIQALINFFERSDTPTIEITG